MPSNNDIMNKILPLSTDIESKSEHYAIEIDLSLFSNQYGYVHSYRIYVRQSKDDYFILFYPYLILIF